MGHNTMTHMHPQNGMIDMYKGSGIGGIGRFN